MKNVLLCAVIEHQMNTQLLFCIKVKKQMVKLGKYFTDFNFHSSLLTTKIGRLENFTVFLATLTLSIMISIQLFLPSVTLTH